MNRAAHNSDPWKDYKRRRRNAWLVFLLAPFVVILSGILVSLLSQVVPLGGFKHLLFWAGIVVPYIVLALGLSVWFILWPCPRCGRPFQTRGTLMFSACQTCLHCGLPKWTTVDVEKEPLEDGITDQGERKDTEKESHCQGTSET